MNCPPQGPDKCQQTSCLPETNATFSFSTDKISDALMASLLKDPGENNGKCQGTILSALLTEISALLANEIASQRIQGHSLKECAVRQVYLRVRSVNGGNRLRITRKSIDSFSSLIDSMGSHQVMQVIILINVAMWGFTSLCTPATLLSNNELVKEEQSQIFAQLTCIVYAILYIYTANTGLYI